MADACLRYRIPLLGNPSSDVALRSKYIAAFGDACYMSDAILSTFNCFYKKAEMTPKGKACTDAWKIPEVFGAAPYDPGYECQAVGNGNYSLQTGPDPANNITIYFEPAPRQTPLVEVDGVPTEVNGPYRNLPEPPTLGPGQPFNQCDSGMVGADGKPLMQHKWILQVNRKTHGGEIHSDLAGFKWPCTVLNEYCEKVAAECEEPLVLHDPADDKPPFDPDSVAQVHHVGY